MPVKRNAQVGLEDKVVSNSELLALLMDREALKEGSRAYRNKDKEVKAAIGMIEEDPPYRIGEFYIERKSQQGRHVEFDTEPGSRIVINKVTE